MIRSLLVLISIAGAALSGSSQTIQFRGEKLAGGFDPSTAGIATANIDGKGPPDVIAWSGNGVKVFRHGSPDPVPCGLDSVRDVISILPGDLNNDGLPDLAILTTADAQIWVNRGGRFQKWDVFIPEGAYNKAIWLDYDHDGDLDLFLLGDKSVLLRNDGAAGFTNVANNFPFVAGRAVDGAGNLLVLYSDRPGVFYEDKGAGRYEAHDVNAVPARAKSLAVLPPGNFVVMTASYAFPLYNRNGTFEPGMRLPVSSGALAVIGGDIAVSGAVFRHEGSGRFSRIKEPALVAAALAAVDFDGDGRTDLISVRPDGSLWFLRNEITGH